MSAERHARHTCVPCASPRRTCSLYYFLVYFRQNEQVRVVDAFLSCSGGGESPQGIAATFCKTLILYHISNLGINAKCEKMRGVFKPSCCTASIKPMESLCNNKMQDNETTEFTDSGQTLRLTLLSLSTPLRPSMPTDQSLAASSESSLLSCPSYS